MKRLQNRKITIRVTCRNPNDLSQLLDVVKKNFHPQEVEVEIGPSPAEPPDPPTSVFADEQLEQECEEAAKVELDKIDRSAKAASRPVRARKAKAKKPAAERRSKARSRKIDELAEAVAQLLADKQTPAAVRWNISQWLKSLFTAGYALTVEKVAKGIADSVTKRP